MKKVEKIKTKCLQCGKEFEVYPRFIKAGKGKFCSISCATTYRNINDNPTKRESVRRKISENHADVSGNKNPMYGKSGKNAPGYIDGRNSFSGEIYVRILKASGRKEECEICGRKEKLHVHHKDGDHFNNELKNLQFLCPVCHNTKAHVYIRDKNGRFVGSKLYKEETEVVL